MKNWRYVPAILLAMLIIALALLLLAMSIPNDNIAKNIVRSTSLYEDGSSLYFTPLESSTTDVRSPVGAIECTMLAFGLSADQQGFWNRLAGLIKAPTVLDCDYLKTLLANDTLQPYYYSRYWHGYSVVYRPLLNFFAYSSIRLIMATGLLALCAAAVVGFLWRGGAGATFGLMVPLLFLDGRFISKLSFALLWAVVFLAVLVVAVAFKHRDSTLKYINIFVVIGGMTSFVDQMTNPIATFMVPATVLLWLRGLEPAGRPQDDFRFLRHVAAAWCVGYFGFWSLKFGLVLLQEGAPGMREIIGAALNRIGSSVGELHLAFGSATIRNFARVGSDLAVLSSAVAAAIMLHPARANLLNTIRRHAAMLALCPLPILWYEVFANHSYIHAGFTAWNSYLIFLPVTVIVAGSWPTGEKF